MDAIQFRGSEQCSTRHALLHADAPELNNLTPAALSTADQGFSIGG